MSEIDILNAMAERAVDHWAPGELYKNGAMMSYEGRGVEGGNCLLGLVGYAVWGESYNAYCDVKAAQGPLKKFLKEHNLKADCLDGYDILFGDEDAVAVISRLADLIRAQGPMFDDDGHAWEWRDGVDFEVVYSFNDALGKDKVIDLIEKARADVGALGEQ